MLQNRLRLAVFFGLFAAVALGLLLVPLPVWQSVMARLSGSSARQAVSGLDARMRQRHGAAESFCNVASKDWLVLVDEVAEKSVYHAYVEGLGNPLFVLGRDGRIVLAMEWTNAEELEAFLKKFLAGPG